MTTWDDGRPAEWIKAASDLRMDGYYISFEGTGSRLIDLILSAIAVAGKGYHHTEGWNEPAYGADEGASYVDLIQDAADDAATEIRQLESDLAVAVHEARMARDTLIAYHLEGPMSKRAAKIIDEWADLNARPLL